MDVRELMTPDPYCLNISDTVQHAAQQMKQHNVGALPVCAGDSLAGIITDRDIATECVASGSLAGQCLVREYMTAGPVTIAPDASVDDALQLMGREQVRRLCVTHNGHLVGMVSLGDIAAHMPSDLRVSQTLAQVSTPVRGAEPAGVS